jgi:hypothetical protein
MLHDFATFRLVGGLRDAIVAAEICDECNDSPAVFKDSCHNRCGCLDPILGIAA